MDPGSLLEWYARDVYPHVMAPLQWLSDRSPVSLTDAATVVTCAAGLLTGAYWRSALSWLRRNRRGAIIAGVLGAGYAAHMAMPVARSPIDERFREPPRVSSVEDRIANAQRSIDLILREYEPAATAPSAREIGAAIVAYLDRHGEPAIRAAGVDRSSQVSDLGHDLGVWWGITSPAVLHREATVPIPSDTIFYPFVLAHEFAHQQGFGQERYAQFIAYAALMESGDARLRVSAALEAFTSELAALRRAGVDTSRWRGLLPQRVSQDFARATHSDIPERWRRVGAPLDTVNDLLLRASGQGDAAVAYGDRFLDLVHAWERAKRTASESAIVEP